MPATLQDRPVQDHAVDAGRRTAPRRRVPVRLVAAGAGLVLLDPAGLGLRDWISGWSTPREPEIGDRSAAPLLLAPDDLSEYHAATADLPVMVDAETDTPWVPSVISGVRVHFLAVGTAAAYVDFEGLDAGAVTLSPDGGS